MTFFRRPLVTIVCGVALSGPGLALAQDASAPQAVEAPKRHELAAHGLAGYSVTDYDYYDGKWDTSYALGIGAEYAYRVLPHLRVGAEGSRTTMSRFAEDAKQGEYAGVWTATPFVGLTWGSGVIQGGVRAGFGFAYGGRRSVINVPDREGPGYDAQLLGELAVCGSRIDVVGRLGFRYTRTSWDAPLAHMYPTDLRLGMAFVTLGARWKL